jgi:hypothetical protein
MDLCMLSKNLGVFHARFGYFWPWCRVYYLKMGLNDMTLPSDTVKPKQEWIEPEVRVLDVRETTMAAPNLGADVGGNNYIDCQRS